MFVTIDEAKVFYKKYDAWEGAKTILILHGRWWSHASWIPVAKWLQQKWYTVIVPDVPWFGKSEMNKEFTIEEYAIRVRKMTEALNLKDIILVGHSNGWRMSIQYVYENSANIDKLFLVNAAAFVHPPTIKQKLFSVVAVVWKKLLCIPGMTYVRTLFYKCIGGHDYLYASKDTNPYKKQTFLYMIATDHTDKLEIISTPTHIIRWKHDTYTPLSDGERLHASITWSTFDVHDEARHGIHLTHPEWLVEKIVSYVA